MEAKGMENIKLIRVDDRLVHGQVMTSWLKATGANKIMVVDDGVAADDLMKTVLKGVVPSQVKLGIFSIEKATDRLFKGFKPDDKVIMLVKTPDTVWELQRNGVDIHELNIGGMGIRPDRTTLYQNIAASVSERQAIQGLLDAGCTVTIQITADDPKVDVAKHL